MNKDKKEYLSLYLAQHTKIKRLEIMYTEGLIDKYNYQEEVEKVNLIRAEIEEKISAVDGVLSEILYLKYMCGKPLIEISYIINYSLRHTERLHIKALEKFKM